MSEISSNPVTLSTPNGFNSDNGLATAVALSSLKDGYDGVGMISAGGICDLRRDVQESRRDIKETESQIRRDVSGVECGLKETIANQTIAVLNRFCDLDKSVLETKHELDKSITRAEYEAKLATQAAIKEISLKVDHEAERTNDKIEHCCAETKAVLCAFEKSVDSQFAKALEDSCSRENRDLRDKLLLLQVKDEKPGNS